MLPPVAFGDVFSTSTAEFPHQGTAQQYKHQIQHISTNVMALQGMDTAALHNMVQNKIKMYQTDKSKTHIIELHVTAHYYIILLQSSEVQMHSASEW